MMKSSQRKQAGWISSLVLGVLIGAIGMGGAMWLMMPSLMLVQHESKFDSLDETITQLEVAIKAHGWSVPAVRNMNKSIEKHGEKLDRQVRIVELCNAKYAKPVLVSNPEVSTLMPCAWGIYEGDDGKIHISGMNMGLMGKMFGGEIAKIMGGDVARDEKNILAEIIKH
jgi:uncharacterized protein (DUF302 family)